MSVYSLFNPGDHLFSIDRAVHKVGKHSIPDEIKSRDHDDRDYRVKNVGGGGLCKVKAMQTCMITTKIIEWMLTDLSEHGSIWRILVQLQRHQVQL